MSEEPRGASTPDEATVESVISIVRASQSLPADELLDGKTHLLDQGLALDSVALLELALALEGRFECRFEAHELTTENFETVTGVAKLIDLKLESAASIDA